MYISARKATEQVEKVRAQVERFLDASSYDTVFTSGATASATLLIATLEHNIHLEEGDEILVTELDHHAILVPLQQLVKRTKAKLIVVPVDSAYSINVETLKTYVTPRTKIVSLIHGSNVTGTVLPLVDMISLVRATAPHAYVIVDASQTVGHIPLSCRELDCDALFFSGHKMCGPTGVGVLMLKKSCTQEWTPSYGGGGAVYSVSKDTTVFAEGHAKFEAGTLPIAEICGLGKAIEYIETYSLEKIQQHIHHITQYAYMALQDLPYVTVYGRDVSATCGVFSITVSRTHPHDVAHVLAEHNIAVRPGYQCAELIARRIHDAGVVRVSVYGYTQEKDIDALVDGLRAVQNTFSL
jgi:cysteine desulfurase / selenocysteine lyase